MKARNCVSTWLVTAALVAVGVNVVRSADPVPPTFDRGHALPKGPTTELAEQSAGTVSVANLIYAGTRTSKCFADHFLLRTEQLSSIATNRRFHAVKLESQEIFSFPLAVMTGEGRFELLDAERANLRRYLERGGFLLASAGCSSLDWSASFRKEIGGLFPEASMRPLDLDHPVFHTVVDIKELRVKHGVARALVGLEVAQRLAVLYSPDGLNDTRNASGCCCCGGNELLNAEEINMNVLAYALAF